MHTRKRTDSFCSEWMVSSSDQPCKIGFEKPAHVKPVGTFNNTFFNFQHGKRKILSPSITTGLMATIFIGWFVTTLTRSFTACMNSVPHKPSVTKSCFCCFMQWELLLADYEEARASIEDIRLIAENFEELCQRNLAANSGFAFFALFWFPPLLGKDVWFR